MSYQIYYHQIALKVNTARAIYTNYDTWYISKVPKNRLRDYLEDDREAFAQAQAQAPLERDRQADEDIAQTGP